MKTPKRIKALADYTLGGHRGDAHQEFRAVVAANGYTMSRGGWVKDLNGDNVCRGWEAFAYMVTHTNEIILSEPVITQDEFPSADPEVISGALATVTDLRPRLAATKPEHVDEDPVEIRYLYSTRVPTVRLSAMTTVQARIVEEATAIREGACESGAALDCAGTGFRRILPESMLPGQDRASLIQCSPCYEWSATRYVAKLHGQTA